MTAPIQDTGDLDSLLVQLVEDCHGIVMEQFLSVIDKNPAFDRTKASILSNYVRKSDVLAEALELIGEDEDWSSSNGVVFDPQERNELRQVIRQAFIKKWGKR